MRCLPKILLLVFGVVPCLGGNFRFFEPRQPPRPLQIIVHRGLMSTAPENTRTALELCIEGIVDSHSCRSPWEEKALTPPPPVQGSWP